MRYQSSNQLAYIIAMEMLKVLGPIMIKHRVSDVQGKGVMNKILEGILKVFST